ncbi:phospholipid/glycerol acyltransferase [Candidatus Magnetoovum chiemensis]|nr:phospholipid/glycerol acyltransferase [Candidatus Magnetoovum chiemensis]
MTKLPSRNGIYKTDSARKAAKALHTPRFYLNMLSYLYKWSALADKGLLNDEQFLIASCEFYDLCESVGMQIEASGLENAQNITAPCVFISNHLSSFETFALPALIGQKYPISIVIKPSLIKYPIFGTIMRARHPIVVSRNDPKEDLKTVLTAGAESIKSGRSVLLFPQASRSSHFDPKNFNSLGIKLAKRTDAQVIPIALKTDVWGNGKYVKDIGKIDLSRAAYIKIGAPFSVTGNGKAEHAYIIDFISENFKNWGGTVL